MADTPETKCKKRLRAWVKDVLVPNVRHKYGSEYKPKLEANSAGAVGFSNGRPDYSLYIPFAAIDIEVKAGSNKPTAIQEKHLKETAASGNYGWCIWPDSDADWEWFYTAALTLVESEGRGVVRRLKLEKNR